jgi:uracil phosphoribosyltransferase
LATGKSAVAAIQHLAKFGNPLSLHFAAVIASATGVEYVQRCNPKHKIWVGSIDETLNSKAYIVPGLGDAGDLSFGIKLDIAK